ncbi:MAG TPA: bifunctional oligoribonuclease/PAP phosphatase NrnA [Blastocatellia bacterium]|jgi:nanoRNase/pAp phosphatase (c-di-AMP/oligoRNAs hydrolase)|nr:bifunctional oligoribonuclease/PAP phosphatase NrnA [Blastocatellia bacterium]
MSIDRRAFKEVSKEVGKEPGGKLADVRPMSKASELAALLEAHRGEKHAIVMQDYPDPDALSAAWAHKMIASRYGIDCDIVYEGRISHQENLALVQLTDIELVRYSDGEELKRYQGTVFVDNQGTTAALTDRFDAAGVRPLVIVDHHERQDRIAADFTDIRKIGATATIYTEYIREGLLELNKSDVQHVRLATALMHGLRSETSGLVRAREEEFDAATFLTRFTDHSLLEDILSVKRSKQVMDVIRLALENREIRESYSISGVGYLRMEDRDSIPQAADFLLTEENVHTVIVYGIIIKSDREMVVGSMRTNKVTLNPDEFLKEALGTTEAGRYYGGGRRGAGGFEIPIGFLAAIKDDDLIRMKWQLYDELIKKKLFAKIGVQPPVMRKEANRGESMRGEAGSLRTEEG